MRGDCGRPLGWRLRRGRVGARALTLLLGLSLALAGGCGGSSLARLNRGTFARAESTTAEPIPVYFYKGEEVVPPGTPVQILDDGEGTISQLDRKVLVAFRAGPHEGIASFVRRRDLRPDPQ